jgi:dephospho-CoA kinase
MTAETGSRFRLGITGGIGSGKTSVCRVFGVLGIPVFSADRVARIIMESDERIIRGINSIAGSNLYVNGKLDRMALAAIIFKNKLLLEKVDALVHPAVFDSFVKWVPLQTGKYVIMEAAILFESGASKLVDRIAAIAAPVEERIERIIERSRLTREQITERIDNQMDDAERIRLSDYVINNSENDMIIPAVLNIHNEILKLINTKT